MADKQESKQSRGASLQTFTLKKQKRRSPGEGFLIANPESECQISAMALAWPRAAAYIASV